MQLENINDSYFLKSNDTATQIHLRVLDYEGNPFPLDTATKIEVVIGVEAGRVLVLTPKLLAGVGEIEFGLDEGDLVPSGKNRLEVHIYTANGEKHNAPSKGYYTLNIQKPIDELGVEVTTYTLDYFLDQVSKATAGLDTIIADGKDAVDKLNEASGRVDGIVISANTALANANTATTKANEATATANAASQTANTAATNANAATQSANTAAGAANTAAGTANQAVVNANAAIKNANDAATEANLWANKAENATQDADNAVIRADAATAKANAAAENVVGWGLTTVWDGETAYKARNTVTHNGSTWQAKTANTNSAPAVGNADWILLAQRGVDGEGSVSSVNGQFPDPDGNVQLDLGTGTVKTVNKTAPDGTGDVTINVGVKTINGLVPLKSGNAVVYAKDVFATSPEDVATAVGELKKYFIDRGYGANNAEIRKIANYNEFVAITESGIYTYLQTDVGSLGLPTDGSNYVLYVTVGSEAVSGATFMSALAVEVGSNDLFSISGKAYTRSVIKRSNGSTNTSEWTELGSTTPTLYTNEDMFLYHALKDGGIYTVESETGSEFFPKGDTIYTVLTSVYMNGAEKQLSYVAVEGNTRGESAVTGRVLSRFIVADGDTATQDSGWVESGGGGGSDYNVIAEVPSTVAGNDDAYPEGISYFETTNKAWNELIGSIGLTHTLTVETRKTSAEAHQIITSYLLGNVKNQWHRSFVASGWTTPVTLKVNTVNSFSSVSPIDALSANKGRELKVAVDAVAAEVELLKKNVGGGDAVVIDGIKYTPQYMMAPKIIDLPLSEIICAGKDYYYIQQLTTDGSAKNAVYRVHKANGKKELLLAPQASTMLVEKRGQTLYIGGAASAGLNGKLVDLHTDTVRDMVGTLWNGLAVSAVGIQLLDDVFVAKGSAANGLLALLKVDASGQKVNSTIIDVKPIFKMHFPASGSGARDFPVPEACHITATHIYLIMRDMVDGSQTYNVLFKIDRNTFVVDSSIAILMNQTSVNVFIGADFNVGTNGDLYCYLYTPLSSASVNVLNYFSINCESMLTVRANGVAAGGKFPYVGRTIRAKVGKNHLVSTSQQAGGVSGNNTSHILVNKINSNNGVIDLVEVFSDTDDSSNVFSISNVTEIPSFAEDLEFIFIGKQNAMPTFKVMRHAPIITTYTKEAMQ